MATEPGSETVGREVLGGLTAEVHERTFGVAIVHPLHLLINIYVIIKRFMFT